MVETKTDYEERPFTVHELPSGQQMTQEVAVNNGVAVVSGRWAVKRENEAYEATGFSELWQSTEPIHEDFDTNLSYLLEDENFIAASAIQKTLGTLGWEPDDVHALIIGNGVIPETSYEYARKIAEISGLPLSCIDPSSGSASFSDACASETRARHYALRTPSLQGKKVLVCDVESITREMAMGRLICDETSNNVFSNGYACTGFIPGQSFQYLIGGEYQLRDIKGALSAHVIYQDLIDFNNNLTYADEHGVYTDHPQPREGYWIDMNGKETSKYFMKMLSNILPYVSEEFYKLYPDYKISKVISHHPSRQMYIATGRALQNSGLIQKIEPKKTKEIGWDELDWVVNDGNASGATSGIAFGRSLENIQKDDVVLWLGFGAGGKASVAITQAFPEQPRHVKRLRESAFYPEDNFDNPRLDHQAKLYIPEYST